MDIIEARTDQTLDPNIRWKWINWTNSKDEGEIFRRATIQEVGEKDINKTVDIWIMSGENTRGVLADNIFHIWSEQDIDSIDWTRGLFR